KTPVALRATRDASGPASSGVTLAYCPNRARLARQSVSTELRGARSADRAAAARFALVGVVSSPAGRDDVALDAEVDVGYAISGDARLAFRVRAGGPHVIVVVPAWVSFQDLENLVPESP